MKIAVLTGIGLALILTPGEAYAYLDPGTGGLLYQMGFALFSLAVGFLFVPFRAVKHLFLKLLSRSEPPSSQEPPTSK